MRGMMDANPMTRCRLSSGAKSSMIFHVLVVMILILPSYINAEKIKPNFLLIHLDDVGYGDFSIYSSVVSKGKFDGRLSKTPQLDRIAREGAIFTSYYASACVCTPSRAGILTGRYPIRTTVFPGVLGPDDDNGMPPEEITIAEWLKEKANYKTFMVGKWHLGHLEPYLPPFHGFDKWTGMPYSHDYCPCPHSLTNTNDNECRYWDPPCPIINGTMIVRQPAILDEVVDYYVQATIEFMDEAIEAKSPFFAYYACHHTHHPQFAKKSNIGKSISLGGRNDAYGDAVWEMDDAIGRIMDHIREKNIQQSTYVFIASDNGAAPIYGELAGSNSPLRCGKGTTWEGGQRVPFIVWGGKTIQGKILDDIVAGMDVFPTISALAGVSMSSYPRVMDGIDFSQVLVGQSPTGQARKSFFFYSLEGNLDAVRIGDYKVHFRTSLWMHEKAKDCHPGHIKVGIQHHPLVYNLKQDIEEKSPLLLNDVAREKQVNAAQRLIREHNCSLSTLKTGCDSSKTLHCYGGPKSKATIQPWPPKPFHPWAQGQRACCKVGYDVVVHDWTEVSEYSCVPIISDVHGCVHQSSALCNPSQILMPRCKGRAVCSENNDASSRVCGSAKLSTKVGFCPKGLRVERCPIGLFQCRNRADNGDAMCVQVAKHCDAAGGIAYEPRPCGTCTWKAPKEQDDDESQPLKEKVTNAEHEDNGNPDNDDGNEEIDGGDDDDIFEHDATDSPNTETHGKKQTPVEEAEPDMSPAGLSLTAMIAIVIVLSFGLFAIARRYFMTLAPVKYHKHVDAIEPEAAEERRSMVERS